MSKVHSRTVSLDQPFTAVTIYDDGETPDGLFPSIETEEGQHEWTVLQWSYSQTFINVNGTTIPLSEVE